MFKSNNSFIGSCSPYPNAQQPTAAQIIYQDLINSFVILTTNGHQKRQIVQHLLVYRLAIKQFILENQ